MRPDLDEWKPLDTAPCFDAIIDTYATGYARAWSGTEWYIWGVGCRSTGFSLGGRFDPVNNEWKEMTTVDAPSPRVDTTGVWIGDRFMAWGGASDEEGYLDSGALYDPERQTSASSPFIRSGSTSVFSERTSFTASFVGAFHGGGCLPVLIGSGLPDRVASERPIESTRIGSSVPAGGPAARRCAESPCLPQGRSGERHGADGATYPLWRRQADRSIQRCDWRSWRKTLWGDKRCD